MPRSIDAICRYRVGQEFHEYDDDDDEIEEERLYALDWVDGRSWKVVRFRISSRFSSGTNINLNWIKSSYKFQYDVIQRVKGSDLTSILRDSPWHGFDDVQSLIPKKPRVIKITDEDYETDRLDRLDNGDDRIRNPLDYTFEEPPPN